LLSVIWLDLKTAADVTKTCASTSCGKNKCHHFYPASACNACRARYYIYNFIRSKKPQHNTNE